MYYLALFVVYYIAFSHLVEMYKMILDAVVLADKAVCRLMVKLGITSPFDME